MHFRKGILFVLFSFCFNIFLSSTQNCLDEVKKESFVYGFNLMYGLKVQIGMRLLRAWNMH